MLIYASGRASPLGELHKCFSHTFQFFRKFLLQRLCKMRVCACVELLSGLWSKAVFLCCLWVGIVLPWLLMGCIPVIQPQGLAPPHFWVHALSSPPLSMFTFPATSAFAWPSPSPSNHTLYNLMPPHIFSVFSCPVHLLHLVSCTTYLPHLCPGKVLGHRNQRSATLLPLHWGYEISSRRYPSIALVFLPFFNKLLIILRVWLYFCIFLDIIWQNSSLFSAST